MVDPEGGGGGEPIIVSVISAAGPLSFPEVSTAVTVKLYVSFSKRPVSV
jgi:hypothetical protein